MKVRHNKTEYVNKREASGMVRLKRVEEEKVHELKYLGSTVERDREFDSEVKK